MPFLPPFEVEITHLGPKGIGVGTAPDGRPVHIGQCAPGSRVLAQPLGRRKGLWQARKIQTIRPAPGFAVPACPQFGTCGGCSLQELGLPAQRAAKAAWAAEVVGPLDGVVVSPPRGTDAAYGYRNKLELTFGVRRWLPEAQRDAPVAGRWLGFHAPGRFDRVVDAPTCALAGPTSAAAIATVRALALADDAPAPYDPRSHEGFWRHLLLRESRDGRLLVGLYTTSAVDPTGAVAAVADALRADPRVVGVVWFANPGVADVARGEVAGVWGDPVLTERLGTRTFRLAPTSFFQTHTAGAEVLYDAVGEAAGAGGTLLDLYCGTGAIGLYLADRFDRILGVEEVASAVDDARENARHNGVEATYHLGRVEDALALLADDPGAAVVVDPPRAGLHPKVAARLAELRARVLVYVACNPASLGRDRALLEAGGWRLTALWVVDLFPQTGHVEVVARFSREPA